MEPLKPLEELLLEHPFFAGMEEGPRKLIAGCGRNEVFHAGDYLFREGDTADRFFLIRHGTVAVELHVPGHEPLVVDTLQSGEIAGWSWLVPPHKWANDARATTLVRAISLDAKCLRGKCDDDHSVGYEVFKRFIPVIAGRLSAVRMQLMDVYGDPGKRR
ncbi:MAG: Crp/Fnr family transcriptional regulator [Gammaproteobacteria bacterium]|nr:MAG: Crp/Fnr family transcriptional regulator [Gammaproteobacteria bacterium]